MARFQAGVQPKGVGMGASHGKRRAWSEGLVLWSPSPPLPARTCARVRLCGRLGACLTPSVAGEEGEEGAQG